MVNTSSEYSITKPGLHHHLRKRDKPLRTYGRRTSSTPEARDEPPSKRQRLTESPRETPAPAPIAQDRDRYDPPKSSAPTACESHQDTSAPLKDEAGVEKSSILSYFKPVTSISPCIPTEPTPPSSPGVGSIKEKMSRLLKIPTVAPPSHGVGIDPNDGGGGEETGSGQDEEDSEDEDSAEVSSKNMGCDSGDPLGRDQDGVHSQRRPNRREQETKRRGPPNAPKPPSVVQTTLNISAQAAFSECRVCDTVWNPLNPDDVKYHTKRHKAVLRAQQKTKRDEL